jgi:flavin reductase (DIM6/NTAB) family NADH-FMN oxidoreductase RutF
MSVDDRTYRKALGSFPTGVTVVTTVDGTGAPAGVTVSAFSSLSLDPPKVLFCLGTHTTSLDAFRSGPVSISVLAEGQQDLSIRFASRGVDKFADLDMDRSADGVPVPKDTLARLDCEVEQVVQSGDHLIVICLVKELSHQTGGQPLVYFRGTYNMIGRCLP